MSTAITTRNQGETARLVERLDSLARQVGITAAQQQLREQLGEQAAYRAVLDAWAATRRVWLIGYRRRSGPNTCEIGEVLVVAENPLIARVLVEHDPDVRMWGADCYGVPGRDTVGDTCDRIHYGPGDIRQH
uniref:hypothetical protein n=1 Tax=Amycolatopsis sp. CA-151526 TaxID=3239921 RepID=UPI003F492E21